MKHSDIEPDLHGIMLVNGLPSSMADHPRFKSFLTEYKCAVAALVLEKAADEAEDDGIMGLLHEDDLIAAKWLRAMSAALQSGDRG